MTEFAFSYPTARKLQVIVTGTGRSGTGYAAKWLSSVGILCGHEVFFDYQGLPAALLRLRTRLHRLVGDSSWQAAPHLDSEPLRDALLIHQVRHPKRVAESCMRVPPGSTPMYLDYLERHLPYSKEFDNDLDKAICRWIHWNRLIESHYPQHDTIFWKVENGTDGLWNMLVTRGMVDPERITKAVCFSNTHYNHKVGEPVEAHLEDVAQALKGDLIDLMGQYGYNWE